MVIDEGVELDMVEWLQGLGGWLDGPMGWLSQLGNPLVFVVIVAGVFWSIDSGVGARMGLFTFAAGSVNEVLKRAFSAPRPFWVSTEVESIGEGSTAFGMPSGHAVGALAWLVIAVRAKRRWVWAVTGLLAALIALSRVYLGAHFPSQVVVGLGVGALLLVAFVRLESLFLDRFRRLDLVAQLGVVTAATGVLLFAGWLSVISVDEASIEAEWAANAAGQIDDSEPFEPADGNDVAATVGIFAGSAVGLVFLAWSGGFDSAGPAWKRLVRFIVGFAVVVIALAVVGIAGGALGVDDGQGTAGVIWEFTSTAITGLAIFFLAPTLFRRVGLAATAGAQEAMRTTAA
ncbi:MAG: phosphatase PAP2 family protein [Acidimicrobiales bacterium]